MTALAAAVGLFIVSGTVMAPELAPPIEFRQDNTKIKIIAYLENKKSPLTSDEISLLVEQKHWKLLIAIAAIESQYCRRQQSFNCWGIGGDSAYRHYESFSDAIVDANNFIERWHQKGRWLTVADMNGSYVVPYSPNWEYVVNKVLKDIEEL